MSTPLPVMRMPVASATAVTTGERDRRARERDERVAERDPAAVLGRQHQPPGEPALEVERQVKPVNRPANMADWQSTKTNWKAV